MSPAWQSVQLERLVQLNGGLVVRFLLVAAVGTALTLLLKAFLSPVGGLPGPWYTLFTDVILKWKTLAGEKTPYVDQLHAVYGPVVRIAPDHVSINDLGAYRRIHKITGGFLKSPWYQRFKKGRVSTFTVIDPKLHAAKRKVLSQPFSMTSLRQNWEPALSKIVSLAVAKIKSEAITGSADIYKWWTLMTADVIGLLAFGETFQMTESGQISPFIRDLETINEARTIGAELTPLISKILSMVGLEKFQPVAHLERSIAGYSQKVVVNARERSLEKTNVFAGVLRRENLESSDQMISDAEAITEAVMLIIAGSGTTAVTLTYAIWSVLMHPHIQDKLEEEVNSLEEGFRDSDLEKLPYLDAVIQETLRLYGAAPSGLPRTVPAGGFAIDQWFIPAGVTVSTQSYSLHRIPSLWPDPEEFRPERWFNATQDQKYAFGPYGAGTRICLGLHLAAMELRLGICLFFRQCAGAKLCPSTTPESMEPEYYFLIKPTSGKCEITLTDNVREPLQAK